VDALAQAAIAVRNRVRNSAVTVEQDGRHGFDFFRGDWRNQNRKLKARLVGSTEWEAFEAVGSCRPMLGGMANVDDMRLIDGSDFEGMSIRIFDPETHLWSIWWADNRIYTITPPVQGRFVDGVGIFRGTDQHDGQPIDVRFIWSGITPTSAKWEQAFSIDNGETWETNWEMFFTRI